MASESDLDEEIARLQARVDSLNAELRIQLNALLTTPATRDAIHEDASTSSASSALPPSPLQARLEKQQAHVQQCTYRICAGITTFRVRDPDPNAVDNGAVLGLRIDFMTRTRFARPYFVFLHRPYASTSLAWRVHRHTVPQCIPLNGLAARYLPAPAKPSGDKGATSPPQQNLPRFARALRREIVRFHNRVAVVAELRAALGLDGKRPDAAARVAQGPIYDITADAESKQLRIVWKDGRAGRLVLGDDGEVKRLVVFGEAGRDREAGRELLGAGERLEDVARKLVDL